jgi:hypothetical protein
VAYFADLTPYAYGHFDHDTIWYEWGKLDYRPRYERRNVGWLDPSQPFARGPVPDWFADALLDVIRNPCVNLSRGVHPCEFCPPGTDITTYPRPGQTWQDVDEIREPATPGVMFAAPTQVWHYVTAHEYRPPTEFVEAVRRYDAGWATEPSPWVPPDAERRVWPRTAG